MLIGFRADEGIVIFWPSRMISHEEQLRLNELRDMVMRRNQEEADLETTLYNRAEKIEAFRKKLMGTAASFEAYKSGLERYVRKMEFVQVQTHHQDAIELLRMAQIALDKYETELFGKGIYETAVETATRRAVEIFTNGHRQKHYHFIKEYSSTHKNLPMNCATIAIKESNELHLVKGPNRKTLANSIRAKGMTLLKRSLISAK